MIDQPEHSTTVRRHGLKVMAHQKVDKARAAWVAAGRAYDEDRSPANLAALKATSAAFHKAEADYKQVQAIYKHNHMSAFVKKDGSDNSMKASLEDAGFGLDGRF